MVGVMLLLAIAAVPGHAHDGQPVCREGKAGCVPASAASASHGWGDRILRVLQQPVSGASEHHLAGWAAWHGRVMVLAWGFLMPLGVLIARFYKVTPRQDWPTDLDNKFWWHSHRLLQYGGVLLMTAGLAIALHGTGAKAPWRNLHTLLGWLIVLLAWLQLASGHLRGSKGGPVHARHRVLPAQGQWAGDHYDMSVRRIAFERLHKGLGYALLALSSLTIFLGLRLADAPLWMWAVLSLWHALYVAAFIRLQYQGRAIDTYQAIWGPDQIHPGNRMRPVGIGIRRYSRESYRQRFRAGRMD